MNISEISETSFENKVSILSRINRVIDKISYGEKHDNLSMTLATLIDYGVVTDMNDKVLILVGHALSQKIVVVVRRFSISSESA